MNAVCNYLGLSLPSTTARATVMAFPAKKCSSWHCSKLSRCLITVFFCLSIGLQWRLMVQQTPQQQPPRQASSRSSCAINLFGLPRSFQSLVLPSLIQNVIHPNAVYHCDYFVHFYNLTQEERSRSGAGGRIHPEQVLLLEEAVRSATSPEHRQQVVQFTLDQETDFWTQYADLLERIHATKDDQDRYLYFPWMDKTYINPTTVDNIVKMWHSIQSVWTLMERSARKHQKQYTRVAMLRSDVVFMTPIDIWQGQNGQPDHDNNQAVVCAFGRYPVCDRSIYGPYRAVQPWASGRFSALDRHVQWILKNDPGWGMHNERFVNYTIFPLIRKTGTTIVEDDHLCFLRARADESVWIRDCDYAALPSIAAQLPANRKAAIEAIVGRSCGKISGPTGLSKALDCRRYA